METEKRVIEIKESFDGLLQDKAASIWVRRMSQSDVMIYFLVYVFELTFSIFC